MAAVAQTPSFFLADCLVIPTASGSLSSDPVGSADFIPGEPVGPGYGHGPIKLGLDLSELFAEGADGVEV